jgi:hypothetical protein
MRPLDLAWVANPKTWHTDTAWLSSHVLHYRGVLTKPNLTATYRIERTNPQGVEQRSSNRPRLRTRVRICMHLSAFMITS